MEHAAVLLIRAEVMPPRLDAAGETVEHPEAHFRPGFAGEAEVRLAGLIYGHAFGDELVPTQEAVDEFAGEAVVLEAAGVGARLMVEHDDFGAAANFAGVA